MKTKTKSTYGQRRVYTRLAHMIDPALLRGIDRLAKESNRSRAEWIRDAIYTGVYRAVRQSEPLMSAPIVPYIEAYECAPQLRIVGTRLCVVDQDGLPIDTPVSEAIAPK